MTRLALLALLSLLSSSVTGSGMIVCEYDDECPASQVCRMVCTRTCRALCVSFGVPTLVNGHRTAPDEPFIAELDPFMRDAPIESATPLTISEAELERELQSDATTFPTPPSGVILTSKSFRPSTTAPRRAAVRVVTSHTTVSPLTLPPSPPVPVTASMQATTPTGPPPLSESAETDLPPSPSPMPPGFTPDHESGYFTTETVSIEHETVEDDNSLEKSTTEIGEGTEEDTETPISDSTEAAESLAESSTIGCPAPPICEKNCGIYVGDDGCQTCQCLWLSSPCEADSDCVENNQFCDLGRCECKPGFVQDMLQSGICKVDSDTPSESDSELQNVGEGEVHNELLETQDSFVAAPSEDQLLAQEASGYASHGGRFRRSQVAEKPSRMERLQWPGSDGARYH